MSNTVSTRTRQRGQGETAEERKLSRAAFKAWDTRRKNEALAKRSAAARKANRNRSR